MARGVYTESNFSGIMHLSRLLNGSGENENAAGNYAAGEYSELRSANESINPSHAKNRWLGKNFSVGRHLHMTNRDFGSPRNIFPFNIIFPAGICVCADDLIDFYVIPFADPL